ncbi:MAG: MFS transporter [Candidatus Hydrothermae bacterium]|nr:MFS transporter [Candidatus Hydrothermae bacterium]
MVIFVYFLVFGAAIGMGMVKPLLPLYLRGLGASAFEVGLLVSGFMLARSISSLLIGALSDRFGRKPFIVAGLLGLSLSTLSLVFIPNPHLVVLMRTLQGFFAGAVWPQLQILVGEASKRSFRSRAIGIYFIIGSLGMGIGSGLASLVLSLVTRYRSIPEQDAVKWVFVIAAFIVLFSMVFIREGKREGGTEKTSEGGFSLGAWIYVFGFFMGFILGLYNSIFLLHLKEFFGFNMRGVALLMFLFGLGGIFFTYLLSHLADKLDGMWVLRGIVAVAAFSSLFLPLTRSLTVSLVLAFLILCTMRGFLPVSRSIVISSGGRKGTKVGALNSVSNLGSVISPLIGGFAYDKLRLFGSRISIFLLLGALILVVLVFEVAGSFVRKTPEPL